MDDFGNAVGKMKSEQIKSLLEGSVSEVAQTFIEWRKNPPVIEDVVQEVIDQLGFSERSQTLITTAAKLASEDAPHAYHNNEHFLEVFCLSAMLGNHAFEQKAILEKDFGNLLTAALLHDYKHDGTGNKGEQFRLEKRAYHEAFLPLLDAQAADTIDLKIIEAMILGTDVSKDFGNPEALSPAETLKMYNDGECDHVHDKLKILEHKGLVDLALVLCDADVGSNFLCEELLDQNSLNLEEESGLPANRQSQQFFLDKVCGGGLHSEAGRALLSNSFDRIKQYVVSEPEMRALENV